MSAMDAAPNPIRDESDSLKEQPLTTTTAPSPSQTTDAEYVNGIAAAAAMVRTFDQDLPGFDRTTCRRLADGLTAMTASAAKRLGVTPPDPGAIQRGAPAARLFVEVLAEMAAQDAKFGPQDHPDGTGREGDAAMARLDRALCKANAPDEDNWRDILQEEVSEAFAETDPAALRAELVQVIAVGFQWIAAIDRRVLASANGGTPAVTA